jgi:immune inhibitor A
MLRIAKSLVLTVVPLLAAGSEPAAAPLHPDIQRDRAHVLPPEPVVVGGQDPHMPGVAGTATRFGRNWTGHPRILVLLVDFADRPADPAIYDPDYFNQLLFSEIEMEYGSLRDWYREVSYERIDVTGEIHGWFRMPLLYADYAAGESGLCRPCYPGNARGLADHAVEAAVSAGIDFRRFDNDGPDKVPSSGDDDGIIDGLMVIFAGSGAERTGNLDDIRSHYWDMAAMTQVGNIAIPDYFVFPERENVGVAVHEFGHLLGAEDLYDLSGQGAGLGNFSVMAIGMWFNNGRSPGRPDPFTMIGWGLVNPEVPGADEPDLRIPASRDVPFVLRLWTRGDHGPEYFLIENRRPGGIDRFLPGDGLLVYHVDERERWQNNPAHYRVALVQADGLRSLEGNEPRNMGDAGDFFPGRELVTNLDDDTDPGTRSNDGSPSLVAIRNIGDPGPEVSVSVEVGRFIAGGPLPRLEILPDEGVFGGEIVPGQPTRLRLLILNQGTRLYEGRFRTFSRDPRVQLLETLDLDMAAIAALDEMEVAGTIVVDLNGVPPTARATIPLEATWETARESYSMAAPLPLVGVVGRRESFEGEAQDIRSMSLSESGSDPWARRRRASDGDWSWGTESYQATQDAVLEIGPLFLTGASELRFKHYMNVQAFGDYASDGGFLEVSTDEGNTWGLLAPSGGYPLTFTLTDGNPYPGGSAWSGRGTAWEEIVVPMSHLEGEVRIRFHFVSDFTGSGGIYEGWFVDELLVRSWEHTHAAVFNPPGSEVDNVRIGFSVIPLFEAANPGGVTLIRETGFERQVLGRWPYDQSLDVSLNLTPGDPGQVDWYWLEWDDHAITPAGPLVVAVPPPPNEPLLRASPSPLLRGRGGSIQYRVPSLERTRATLDLFDSRGGWVTRLVEGEHLPGPYRAAWPSRSESGRGLSAGVYFLKLSGSGFQESRRVVLIP